MEGESRCFFSLQAQAMFTHRAALPSKKGGPPRPQVRAGERPLRIPGTDKLAQALVP